MTDAPTDETKLPGWLAAVPADDLNRLVAKAKALVALLDDAERNHGALIGVKTLRAVGELRLELSRWAK